MHLGAALGDKPLATVAICFYLHDETTVGVWGVWKSIYLNMFINMFVNVCVHLVWVCVAQVGSVQVSIKKKDGDI